MKTISQNSAIKPSCDRDQDIRVLRSVEEIEGIRSIWEQMQVHPSTHIEVYLDSLANDAATVEPCVILLCDQGEPQMLAAGRIVEKILEFRIGYLPIYRKRGRVLSILDRGILGKESNQHARQLTEVILSLLKQGSADMAHLASMPVESQVYAWTRSLPHPWHRSYFLVPDKRWTLRLPGTFEQFLKQLSPKSRSTNLRSNKKLEQTFGDRLSMRCVVRPEEIDAALDQMEVVAEKTYQRRLGTGFMNTAAERRFLKFMAHRGLLSIDLLSIDGRPVAFCYGFQHRNVYLYETPGYDPEFAHYRVGNYLLLKLIERLCADPNIQVIDFGYGDAQYKQVYSNTLTMESHARIFAPTLNGLCLNGVRSLTFLANNILIESLKGSNLYLWARRMARERLRRRK